MKAVMKTKLEKGVEIVDVPTPKVKPEMVLIKVKAAGICGSDLHFYNATETGPALPYIPYILGHEGAGDVVEVGKGVEDVKVGDRVTYNPFVSKQNQFC